MKFILFVEGYTEKEHLKAFLKKWFDAQEGPRVGLDIVRFEGWSNLYDRAKVKFDFYMNGPRSKEIIAVVSLLDLYGPTFYPKEKITVAERWQWGREYMEGRISHPQYRHFFAVHETEAWLLAEPGLFAPKIRDSLQKQNRKPEEVNTDTPPAKMLNALYQKHLGRGYQKVTDGSNLFPNADPHIAAEACPYLKIMLTEMWALAQARVA